MKKNKYAVFNSGLDDTLGAMDNQRPWNFWRIAVSAICSRRAVTKSLSLEANNGSLNLILLP